MEVKKAKRKIFICIIASKLQFIEKKHIGIGSEYADYGYYWWIKTLGSQKTYFALGYGGQYILVIPDLNIVVVITSRWDKEAMEPDYFMDIVNTYVIGSVITNK